MDKSLRLPASFFDVFHREVQAGAKKFETLFLPEGKFNIQAECDGDFWIISLSSEDEDQ